MSCSINSILDKLFRSQEMDDIIYNVLSKSHNIYDRDNFDDIKQELFLILLKKDSDLIVRLHNEKSLYYYIIRILMNQIRSKSSPYYKNYKKKMHSSDEEQDFDKIIVEEEDDPIDDFDIIEYCNENKLLNWYENEMMCLYYKIGRFASIEGKMTYRRIEEEYGIDHCAVYKTIANIKEKIIESLK